METDPALVLVLEALKAALAVPGRRVRFVQLLMEDGTSQLITLPAKDSMPAREAEREAETVRLELTDREKSVLAVLKRAERPLKGRTIATRAGIRYNSHFRDVMSGLRERKLVNVDEERRYWPADRPLPTAEGEA